MSFKDWKTWFFRKNIPARVWSHALQAFIQNIWGSLAQFKPPLIECITSDGSCQQSIVICLWQSVFDLKLFFKICKSLIYFGQDSWKLGKYSHGTHAHLLLQNEAKIPYNSPWNRTTVSTLSKSDLVLPIQRISEDWGEMFVGKKWSWCIIMYQNNKQHPTSTQSELFFLIFSILGTVNSRGRI